MILTDPWAKQRVGLVSMLGHSRAIRPPLSASCAELPKEESGSAFFVQILRLKRVELTLDSAFPLQWRVAGLC